MLTKNLLCKDLKATTQNNSHDIYERPTSRWPSTCLAQAPDRTTGSPGRQALGVKIQRSQVKAVIERILELKKSKRYESSSK